VERYLVLQRAKFYRMIEKPIYGLVYLATNLINGKKYVGITSVSLMARQGMHKRSARPIGLAIRKYGMSKFSWRVIDVALTLPRLKKLEQDYIKFYNCVAPKGYNLTNGGDSIQAPCVRKVMSKRAKERWNRFDPKLGCTYGEWHNKRNPELNARRGRTLSAWANDPIRSANWRRNLKNQKPSIKRTEARRALWADPIRKERWMKSIRASWTPEAHKRQSERFKLWHANRKATSK
jgi:group I intron endonuclease